LRGPERETNGYNVRVWTTELVVHLLIDFAIGVACVVMIVRRRK
jgi:hypothetical protein